MLVGAWEWIRLSGFVNQLLIGALLVIFGGVLIWSYLLPNADIPMILGIGCLVWCRFSGDDVPTK